MECVFSLKTKSNLNTVGGICFLIIAIDFSDHTVRITKNKKERWLDSFTDPAFDKENSIHNYL